MSRPASNVLELTNQSSSYSGSHYHRKTNQDIPTASFYEFASGTVWLDSSYNDAHGIELRLATNGDTEVHTNTASNSNDPISVECVASGATPGGPGSANNNVTINSNDIGSELYFYTASTGSLMARHEILAGTLWTSSGGSSGGQSGSGGQQPSQPSTVSKVFLNFW